MKNCTLCDDGTPALDQKIEDVVMDLIKRSNPDWVESDGACTKCDSYYRKLVQIVEVEDK